MTDLTVAIEAEPEEEATFDRDQDLLGRRDARSPIRKKLAEVFKAVREGFDNQADRSDDQLDYWDTYFCRLNSQQAYNGNSSIYWPIIRDAVNARATRFVNQLFPQSGRYVDAIDSDGSGAPDLVALLDYYIRSSRFKTSIAKPLSRNGDIEGHYNLCVDWTVVERQIVSRAKHGPMDPQLGVEGPGEEMEDIQEEDIKEGYPGFEVLHDSDVLVMPSTADTIEEALARGGHVAIVRRWTKAKIEQMRDEGAIREDEADALLDNMTKVSETDKNTGKRLAEHVGITARGKEAVVWEVWANLKLGDNGKYSEKGKPRLCRIFLGPSDAILGAKRNPYWNDRCPLLSCPVEKVAGVFKGDSLVAPIASIQYEANDAVNEGADAAAYSALPIVVRDSEKADGPMILNLAAIWDVPPDSVKFMTFPDLTPRAIQRVQVCIGQIFQSLGVNPAMIPQQTRAGKPSQAQVAQEQSVDLLTTAESVSVLEESIFTPACGWMVDLDYQFRDDPLTVRMFGEMGHRAKMQEVAPLQNRNGFSFVWRGGEQARQNAMMMQQGTGWLNVLRSMRQDLAAEGIQIRLGPLVEAGTRNIFGPMLGGQVIVDQRENMTLDPQLENQMLLDGFEVPVHPLDDEKTHIQAVQSIIQSDIHGTARLHLQAHLKQMQAKAQAAMMQKMAQQGAPPGHGGPGAPQPGAAPAGPRAMKAHNGAVPPDSMPRAGATSMPRRV